MFRRLHRNIARRTTTTTTTTSYTTTTTTNNNKNESLARSLFEYSNSKWKMNTCSVEVRAMLSNSRRCLALRRHFPRDLMIRFVLAHERYIDQEESKEEVCDDDVNINTTNIWLIPDTHRKFKGKGAYVSSKANAIDIAVKNNVFQHSFQKKNLRIPDDILEITRKGLRQHALEMFVYAISKATAVERVRRTNCRPCSSSSSPSSSSNAYDNIKEQIDTSVTLRDEMATKHSPKLWTIIPRRRRFKIEEGETENDDEDDEVIIVEATHDCSSSSSSSSNNSSSGSTSYRSTNAVDDDDDDDNAERLKRSYACDMFSTEEIIEEFVKMTKSLNGEEEEEENKTVKNELLRELMVLNKDNDDHYLAFKGIPEKLSFDVRLSFMRMKGFDKK